MPASSTSSLNGLMKSFAPYEEEVSDEDLILEWIRDEDDEVDDEAYEQLWSGDALTLVSLLRPSKEDAVSVSIPTENELLIELVQSEHRTGTIVSQLAARFLIDYGYNEITTKDFKRMLNTMMQAFVKGKVLYVLINLE